MLDDYQANVTLVFKDTVEHLDPVLKGTLIEFPLFHPMLSFETPKGLLMGSYGTPMRFLKFSSIHP